ncbi:MAG TPA: glycoside hydrolase family 2 TIM barrel-domain containing protein [Dyella sp.]|uniref:glycoside hydrolase family 2 TIM barrel-domain containing protein n=1 Tax=Dyella sp. TaxID=1869338 RepID=UPI002C9F21C5|nr:glycoside hydrolase family 2 TIM barrel-domain containing protein [Dyella sp.]HUB91689.1 glycoside hydrolase family 2 TIM barrel-domain containing protein [Dyella sp.]
MVLVPTSARNAFAALIFLALALPLRAEQRNVSQDWLFHQGDVASASSAAYDDHAWHKVAVPHDWSIASKPDGSAPYDPNTPGGQNSGYLPGGIGWYRRHIAFSAADVSRIVRLNFEAIYMDADIWLNGQHLAQHHYGYTAFSVDLTGKVHAGDNVVAIRVNHADPSSRWYAGSGLIRPVSLDVLNRVHLDPDSIFVRTPEASPALAQVLTHAVVVNDSTQACNIDVVAKIVAANGDVVAQSHQTKSLAAGMKADWDATLSISNPALWSPDSPNLYTLVQDVYVHGAATDERRTRFGARTISVDAVHGLLINGKPVLLRGGNIHHDNYMLGGAGWPDADARKVALMKAAGYNAIRSAHNPASQATLNAADEVGMLVIDEAFDMWNVSKTPMDYARFFKQDWRQDLDSLVISGRNHPSVLFWSIGNEIPEQGTPLGVEIGRKLAERVRALDPSRPITEAISVDTPHIADQFAILDVAGYNYNEPLFVRDHQTYPQRVMLTTESTPKSAFTYRRAAETMPWVIGDFVWTAVDYLGETGIGWMGYSQDWQKLGPYPWHLAYCGEIDATGRKRPAAYYREVIWKTGIDPISMFVQQPAGTEDLPDRHMFTVTQPHTDWSLDDVHPSWTWPGQEGKPLNVVVYSEFPEVEVFLNGKSLGRKAVNVDTEYKATYAVPYRAGRLVAVGYQDGHAAGQWTLRTAGKPASVDVSVDRTQLRANGEDLAYLTITLADDNGTPVYNQEDDRRVSVRVVGAGELAGMGNGKPDDVTSFQSGTWKTFHGRVVAVVRAGLHAGPIAVQVDVDGLPVQQIYLNAVSP